MNDRPQNLGARLLIFFWLIVIVGGFFVGIVMSIIAFKNDSMASGLVFGAIAIGCAMLCYRTYVSRDELRSNVK